MRNDGVALPNFMRRAFTPHSSLDSEIDVNAGYLENAILVTADLRIPRSGIAPYILRGASDFYVLHHPC